MLAFHIGKECKILGNDFTAKADEPLQAFTLFSHGEFMCDSTYYTKRSGDERCLLLYTLSGQGVLEYNGKTAMLEKSSLVLLSCSPYQHYKTGENGKWHFIWMHYSESTFHSITNTVNDGSLHVAYMENKQFMNHYNSIIQATGKDGNAAFEVSFALHNLLLEVLKRKNKQGAMRYQHFDENIKCAASYIRKNFSSYLSLEKIAKQSNISMYHFIRVFTAIMGLTPYQYLTVIRIDECKKMLCTSDLSVAQIASAAGFQDVKVFITNFKKHTGLTPLQFRKTNITHASVYIKE